MSTWTRLENCKNVQIISKYCEENEKVTKFQVWEQLLGVAIPIIEIHLDVRISSSIMEEILISIGKLSSYSNFGNIQIQDTFNT